MRTTMRLLATTATVLLFGLVLAPRLQACLNDFDDDGPSHPHYNPDRHTPGDTYVEQLRSNSHTIDDAEMARREALAQSGDFRARSDYAVALLRRGNADKGLKLLQNLAQEHSDDYVIAANLGTAYELSGDNANALVWIRKGIALNPQAHEGTEWLHARILEAKIQAEKNPAWLASHRVLEVAAMPGSDVVAADLRRALEYQLHERLGLVPAPDAICADLLVALGERLLADGDTSSAQAVLRLARDYDPSGRFASLIAQLMPPVVATPAPWAFNHRAVIGRLVLMGLIVTAVAACLCVGCLRVLRSKTPAKLPGSTQNVS